MVLESSQNNLSRPELSDTITADFHGTLMDGSVFWSSIDIGEPLTIQLSQLIPGCQKVISLMQEGDFWRVFIHPSMAYGEEGRPTIPPNSALTFDIKLHAIK
jgi:FKBP-type peptidyl-prolyl cis-trans isomerase